MADGFFVEAFGELASRLLELAARDETLRDALRAAARAVLDATGGPSAEPAPVEATPATPLAPAPVVEEAVPTPVPVAAPPPPPRVSATELMAKLWPGRSRLPRDVAARAIPPPPAPPASPPKAAPVPTQSLSALKLDAELVPLGTRCRLKAEGARWAATRRRKIAEGADFRDEIAPRDRQILDRAGELGCYLWMNSPEFPVPDSLAPMEDLAGWFDAVADAIELVREVNPEVQANRSSFEPALDLLARAQSALRVAVEAVDGPRDDDQFGVYNWLRGVAAREQIYIRHHMRLDDPADPSRLLDFDADLERLEARFQGKRADTKQRKSALSTLRYHAKLIGQGDADPHHWRKVAEAIESLVQAGVHASNVEIREILLPILDRMPEEEEFLSPSVRVVLREVDRYLASRNTNAEPAADDQPTPEVAEVARLLRGKRVLLIGGVRRNFAHQALRAAFQLDDLVWFETREHESIEVFEPHVARPEVVLVLLAIRWSSHSFEGVKRFCDLHDKPMVRLPGGYGVNQVATQILAQVSGRLQAD